MSDPQAELEQVRRAADELIPQLTERLARSGLGEIEVRSGDLRVRVSAGAAASGAPPASVAAPKVEHAGATHPAGTAASRQDGVVSPAVGYFVFGDGLGPGLAVQKGDALGFVDVLGVRHDVRAPRSGTVRRLVTETGEAVEYGQMLLEIEASGA